MSKSRHLTLIGMILIAALSRLVPHPWNVTPVTGIALFAGAYFHDTKQALVIPLVALLLSDLLLGFYGMMPAVYAAFLLTVLLGKFLKGKKSISRVALTAVSASLMFFVITNFASWIAMPEYTKDFSGFVRCYVQALPFFRNTLLGDLFYTGLLFGSFALSERTFPQLRESAPAH